MAEITGTGETGLTARYAAALYALAFEQNALNEVIEQMQALGRLIAESAPLKQFLANPLTDAAKARQVLADALAAQGFGTLVRNFVNVVVANRRLRDLPAPVAGFAAYVAAKRGEVVADVTSSHELTELQRTQLRARLAEAGYGNVRLVEHTDPSLLGGLVLKVGAKLFDTSLKSRLNRLNYSLKGAA
ncbi:ATP synthase F1 subunit delta [Acidocella aromatica]|uniref:ATP synthase subunit delta n=1 Tax=Acidocella aromatica TaxID=1303579 RepID=A0A840VB93_9PROT|nr:ATP synthase F1 subunit delta [Acidocella aromatica]MBB5372976.1 F-type H+-transporting ATPase subunit delta [Acidocella aromatica]